MINFDLLVITAALKQIIFPRGIVFLMTLVSAR